MKTTHTSTLTALALVALMLAATGCTRFPYGMSLDRHNFESTPHLPATVTLIDTITGETLWTLDVPVGKMAVVDLDHRHDWTAQQTSGAPAHEIRWAVLDTGTTLATLPNKQDLPGNPVKLKVTYRKPESVAAKPE